MGCWVLQYIVIPLVSALIGGGLTLVGVRATIKHGDKIRNDDHERETKVQAKPILINYPPEQASVTHSTTFSFSAPVNSIKTHSLRALVKNTDNGILFLDSFESEDKQYLPQCNSAVDKNEAFIIVLHVPKGETLTKWRIHCHDIYGTKYYYDAEYGQDNDKQQRILIGNIQAEE